MRRPAAIIVLAGLGLIGCQTGKVETSACDALDQSAHIQCYWSGERSPLTQCQPTRESHQGCGLGASALAAYDGLVVKNLLRDQDYPTGTWVGFEVYALPDGSWGRPRYHPDDSRTFVIDVPAPKVSPAP